MDDLRARDGRRLFVVVAATTSMCLSCARGVCGERMRCDSIRGKRVTAQRGAAREARQLGSGSVSERSEPVNVDGTGRHLYAPLTPRARDEASRRWLVSYDR